MQHYITLNDSRNIKLHYENFPVASLLFPKKQRDAAMILYHYARTCDDIADEGIRTSEERLSQLKPFADNIKHLNTDKTPSLPLFVDIKHICKEFAIEKNLLSRLMQAFEQDVYKKRYQNMDELINYCKKAACPAGQMILTLFNNHSKKNIRLSNHLCIALAMIGMLQDIHEDYLKGRIYIPKDDFKKFSLTEKDIANKNYTKKWQLFKDVWLSRIYDHLKQGEALEENLTGRLRLQIKVLKNTSNLLVNKLKNSNTNIFIQTPKLTKFDWGYQFLLALIKP